MFAAADNRRPELDEIKRNIIAFITDFTAETTPGSAAKIPDYRDHLRPGTPVYITFLPGSDFKDTIRVATRLKEEGFKPIPHLAARSIPSRAFLEENMRILKDKVDLDWVLIIGGAVNEPVGEFSEAMQILETGLIDKFGIKRVGLAGHPEGNPDIGHMGVADALRRKNAFAETTDAELYLVTQFCFEAAPIIAWDKRLQAEGNSLPIHIGVPGLATIKTLMAHAKACGIGPSMRFLTRQARNITKLMSVSEPDRLVTTLANYKAQDPTCGIQRVHMYPLGGLSKTAAWTNAVCDGRFTMEKDGLGFNLDTA
jgi:methylenetetrahydrofolate reductase (NADPH)